MFVGRACPILRLTVRNAKKVPVRVLGFMSAMALLAATSCRDATQAQVSVRTNVPHRAGLRVALFTGANPASVSESAEPWGADGRVGDLVFVPGEKKDASLSFRVVMGIGRDPSSCSNTDAAGCIVARRSLAFVPRTRLRVPVVLHQACVGVVCPEEQTCNDVGQCVSAKVDANACATADGCVLPGDERVQGVRVIASDAGADNVAPDVESPDSATVADASPDAVDAGADAGLPPLVAAQTLAVGLGSSCAISGTTLKCWGRNGFGQLGLGDENSRGAGPNEMGAALPAVNLGAGNVAVEVAAGGGHACAILQDRSIKCWGSNDSGQLGLGDSLRRGMSPNEMGDALPKVDLGPGALVVQVAAGADHTCALLADGSVRCWGANAAGQLGLGDQVARGASALDMGGNLPAVDLGPGRKATALAVGQTHGCAGLDNGDLKCWGAGANGRLGLEDQQSRGVAPNQMGAALPVVGVGPGLSARSVSAGGFHTCALLNDDAAKCWGINFSGVLGQGDQQLRGHAAGTMGANLLPIQLGAGLVVAQLVSGANHACARFTTGTVKCWGSGISGQLGIGASTFRGGFPGEMGDVLPLIDLGPGESANTIASGAGADHVCARLVSGGIKCWGANANGQLGQGDTANRGDGPGEMGATLPLVVLQ
jgi:alpha-tubulin suppressor-like RCC1 family protein